MFADKGGWSHEEIKDNDPVLSLEKQVADSNPLWQVDLMATEEAKVRGVQASSSC